MRQSSGSGGGPAIDPDRGGASDDLWIETRRGGLFFVNALLVFPYAMILLPLLTRLFVRGVAGGLPEESQIVDTFPLLAEFLMPRYGWLSIIPLVLVIRNLAIEPARLPRIALGLFLFAHVVVLLWTVSGWAGVHDFGLPGGPPGR